MREGSAPAIPQDAHHVVGRYLELADEALPDRIEGLYLIGSIALGDYQPGQSDIDFVAVTDDPLTDRDLDRLEDLHQRFRREVRHPVFSGVYVTWSDLERNPEQIERVPFFLEGEFGRSGGFDANPSTWLTLRKHPVAVRGPIPHVWHDRAVVRRWNLDNLDSYWRGQVDRLERAALLVRGEKVNRTVLWCVPGVTRLLYTIRTDDITSKAGACRYALAALPERWHPILSDALGLRIGNPVQSASRSSRLKDTIAYMRYVIEEANREVNQG